MGAENALQLGGNVGCDDLDDALGGVLDDLLNASFELFTWHVHVPLFAA
jgi:hypothetical protein